MKIALVLSSLALGLLFGYWAMLMGRNILILRQIGLMRQMETGGGLISYARIVIRTYREFFTHPDHGPARRKLFFVTIALLAFYVLRAQWVAHFAP